MSVSGTSPTSDLRAVYDRVTSESGWGAVGGYLHHEVTRHDEVSGR